ncbi:hypothetical protein AB0942_28600 [Streptomyces nodosus]|uniref:hypothetical protein n=1 Tax=Streptomyces nodosus TaxID=40318 RepID=UPI0034557384
MAMWLESRGPGWRAFDTGDWQDTARQWHQMTGLPIHPTVQDQLYERHGPESLSATRELDDLAEAVRHVGHPWAGKDLVDLAAVTLSAMDHGAPPYLRAAAFACMDQLAVKQPLQSRTATTCAADGPPLRHLWGRPAAELAQHIGIETCGLMDSLAELEIARTTNHAPVDGFLDLVNARALELPAAASRVIRARIDPKAEDRLQVLARRRLKELERVTRVAATTRMAHDLSVGTDMVISREQMRTALIEERYSGLERRAHLKASTAGTRTVSCAGRTREPATAASVSQSVEAAMEDRA